MVHNEFLRIMSLKRIHINFQHDDVTLPNIKYEEKILHVYRP